MPNRKKLPKIDLKGVFTKNPDMSTLKYLVTPKASKKSKSPDLSATASSCRASTDRILQMEQKLNKFIAEMNTPHPLMGLLDKKKKSSAQKWKTGGRKTMSLGQADDSISNGMPESFTLKGDVENTDIHRAREIQQLIENRRRFFDGELNTTFDKVGSQNMKGIQSSDDETTVDSGRATFGGSESTDKKVPELQRKPSVNVLFRKSGYSQSEDEEDHSAGDNCAKLLGKLNVFEQKARTFLKENAERDKVAGNKNKNNPSLALAFAAANITTSESSLTSGAPAKSGQRVQKKKVVFPKYVNVKTQRQWNPKLNLYCFKPPSTTSITSPIFLKPKRKFKKNLPGSKSTIYVVNLDNADKDSSSDEDLPPPVENLKAFATTGPAVSEDKFSMTEVIRSTREFERQNDIRIGLEDPSKLSKKKVQEYYGPVAEVATRTTPKNYQDASSPRANLSDQSPKSAAAASVTISSDNVKNKNDSQDEHSNIDDIMSLLPPPVVGLGLDKMNYNLPPMTEIEKTSAYTTWKLDQKSNGTMPVIIKPTASRFEKNSAYINSKLDKKSKQPLTTGGRPPVTRSGQTEAKTKANETLKPDQKGDSTLAPVIPTPVNRRNSKEGNIEEPQYDKNILMLYDHYQDDPFIAMRGPLPPQYQALKGQTRPNTARSMNMNMNVPIKYEGIQQTDSMEIIPPKKNHYNKLQMKQEMKLPGEHDYSKDPRYLSLLEVLEPVYEPRIPTWKNMPAPVPKTPKTVPSSTELELVGSTIPDPDHPPISVPHKKREIYPPFVDPRHIPLVFPKPR